MQTTESPQTAPKPDSFEPYSLSRKNNTPLRFRGVVIANAEEQSPDNDVYQRVTLFRTRGGKYAAARVRDANYMDRIARDAFCAETPAAVIDWLRGEDGDLDLVAQEALSIAAEQDSAFDAAYSEDVP